LEIQRLWIDDREDSLVASDVWSLVEHFRELIKARAIPFQPDFLHTEWSGEFLIPTTASPSLVAPI
jgi:hypothetical protein